MMLSELLHALSVQAVKASGIHTVVSPVGAKLDFGVLLPDGSFQWRDVEPDPRQHKVSDVASLVAFADQMNEVKAVDDGMCVLWYARSGAVLIVDDATRRDRVTLPLAFSPQLMALAELTVEGKNKLDQAALAKLLRVSLAGCWSQTQPNLAKNISKLKLKRTEDGYSEVTQGKASLGKSLLAEMSGVDPIPEEVTFTVPVFLGNPWTATVACDLQVIAEEGKFALTPLAGAIESAIRLGENDLAVDIRAEMTKRKLHIPLYYGTP